MRWPGCGITVPRGGCCGPTTRRWCSASCIRYSSPENVRSISATELASRLDDELYALNERGGEPKKFPRPAKAYLDDWAAPEAGWLRKYYPEGTDEPHVDVTPAVEKALQWVGSLAEREFVGTESRLNTIIDLLRQIVFGTETDPEQRIAELRRQRQEIGDQIARIGAGELDLLDASAFGTVTSSSP